MIILNRDLIIESNFHDFSNKLEFLPEPRPDYRINFRDFSNKLEFLPELRSSCFLRNVVITKIPVFSRNSKKQCE